MPPAPRARPVATLPTYSPMIPTLIAKPFHRDGWVYEEKVDGYRMLAYKAGPRVQLLSRRGIDHAWRYPDVAAAIAALPAPTVVLDGELAVFDKQLRSRFDWLRHRQPAEVATPPVLIAFDVLYLKGRDITIRPLRDRRRRLVDLIADTCTTRARSTTHAAPARTAWVSACRRPTAPCSTYCATTS